MAHLPQPGARPIFFNLIQIQMPVGALTSIAHRMTGVLLAVSVPIAVYLLDISLRNEQGFVEAMSWVNFWAFKGAAIVLVWALAHHMLAGVRHLLTDISVGSTLHTARRSAWAVNLGGVVIALLVGGLWL
ncbi:MAG: succinate dehydrogenase, cytochrome b556 subunit [Polaromonas sp.]|nr:succinate dehydrogenase, cytochrome b556 subunit [Polaromonas sp.]